MFFDVETFAGERWENKKKAVEKLMTRDRARDTLLATAEAPEPIHCLTCRAQMKVMEKEIYEAGEDERDCVIFFYECPNHCLPRRVFFDNGEEHRPKVHRCVKCQNEVSSVVLREKGEIIITDTCIRCGHVETTKFGTAPAQPLPDPDFIKDYQRFCYTEEQGKEYLKTKADRDASVQIGRELDREDKKKKLAIQIAKIKKLTITDAEALLGSGLEKEQYGKLHLSAPEIGRFFIVPFTVQDLKQGRAERESISALEKLMETLLAPTNWRIASEGIYSQLGVLSGRLRGFDKEYELVELIERERKKKNAKK
jgi:hypothetical protein